MANVDQRKYLKKYLDDDQTRRRKKKSREHSSSRSERVRIVDDDGDYARAKKYDDDNDFILTGEDAPQIVGIVDDRPPELKAKEDFRNSSKWRSLQDTNDKQSRAGQRYEGNSQKYSDRRRSRSPIRRDYSPPRRPERREEVPATNSRKRRSEDDYSPVRRKQPDANSRPREVSGDDDLSPVRRQRRDSDGDLLPVRKKKEESIQKDLSPPRKEKVASDDDLSPVRRRKFSASPPRRSEQSTSGVRKSRFSSPDDSQKMKRTLDGKRAGLQDAQMLKTETDDFRRREDKLFKKMSNDISGRHADVVVRDKRSGRVRDLERERVKDEEKQQREKERKEVYDRWGKGLKQVEDYQNKVANDQYEGNKPLARYSDDADLDKMLREQERIGDPMLAYMREKSIKKTSNMPKVPVYNGPYPDNRFNIRPGYRWDGVDRSNGYEKKWLTVQNQKIAIREEAYRYSTEDM